MQARLVSLVTPSTMDKCNNFINKVRESRYIKVRDEQINKFSRLMGGNKDMDLSHQEAEELRADINRVLRSSQPLKPNLTKAELQAFSQPKEDRTRIVLTADKGVAIVVMDRKEYIDKATNF